MSDVPLPLIAHQTPIQGFLAFPPDAAGKGPWLNRREQALSTPTAVNTAGACCARAHVNDNGRPDLGGAAVDCQTIERAVGSTGIRQFMITMAVV